MTSVESVLYPCTRTSLKTSNKVQGLQIDLIYLKSIALLMSIYTHIIYLQIAFGLSFSVIKMSHQADLINLKWRGFTFHSNWSTTSVFSQGPNSLKPFFFFTNKHLKTQ